MSYLLSSLLFKNKNIYKTKAKLKQSTPNQLLNNKINFYSPLKTEVLSTQGTLTQSTHYTKIQKSSTHKRNISFFKPITPIKRTQVPKKQIKPLTKISLTESDRTEILSFYVHGISPAKLYPFNNQKRMITLQKENASNRNHLHFHSQFKSRNKVEVVKTETNEELFDRYNKKTYAGVKQYISALNRKHKIEILNEHERLYSSDFKIANRTRFTKDLRIVDHADYDYETMCNVKEKNYDEDIKCYNKHFYNTQLNMITNNNDKKKKSMTTIEETIMILNQKTKEDIYAKWKKLIVKAADQFRRSHLSLRDLYAGKYSMTVPFQEQFSEAFFQAVKYQNNNTIDTLLKKNIYLVHSYDYVRFYF